MASKVCKDKISNGKDVGLIQISKSDYEKLLKLFKKAKATPQIKTKYGLSTNFNQVWEDVIDFQTHLGKKYGYGHVTHEIHPGGIVRKEKK